MELREYQKQAIAFWKEYKKVYFAIDMGLGKTAIVLHTLADLKLKALIIAPHKVVYNTWPEEIKKWELGLDFQILHGSSKDRNFEIDTDIHLINYEGLPWFYNKLFKMFKAGKPLPYQVLVLDESTFIKDPNSNRFKYIQAMQDTFEYIANLSGTPSPNSLMDLWAQYYILDKGKALGDNFNRFKQRFYTRDAYRKFTWYLCPGAETTIYKAVAQRTFRLDSSDYIELPRRQVHTISLDLRAKEKALYKSFQKDSVLLLEEAQIESLNAASLSSKCRQFVQGFVYENRPDGDRRAHIIHDIKIRAFRELVASLQGINILALIQYKAEVEELHKVYPEACYITGNTTNAEGNRHIQDWNAGKVPLLFAHPKAVGRGLNLQTGGFTMAWIALPWSLDDYLQTNKRLHRPGQKRDVDIYHLVLRETIDEKVLQALQMKGMTQARLLEFLRIETKKEMEKSYDYI
jgi:SNF2 family DNA or RNA helicase